MNNRGIALILTYMVIASFLVLFVGSGFVSRSVNESFQVNRYLYSTTAYWLSEAGVAEAVKQLPSRASLSGNIFVGSVNGSYSTTTQISGVNYDIISTGTFSGVQRTIKVTVSLPTTGFGNMTSAIGTTGELSVRGSVDINPEGSYTTQSELDFQEIFGTSKEAVKSVADHLYTDPGENQQPVNGITWVDLTGDTPSTAQDYKISSNWSGSGLLIIDGHRNDSTKDIAALEISGGWHFDGVIWVLGKIKISGTPVITGSLFAESAVDVESDLTGNAVLNFSAAGVADAFGLLTGKTMIPTVKAWYEL